MAGGLPRSEREFVIAGVGVSVSFRTPRPEVRPVPVATAERGRFEGAKWVPLHPMRRERLEARGSPVTLLEPGAARDILAS